MKKNVLILMAFMLFAGVVSAQKNASIVDEVFGKSAEDKVTAMQQLIGFDDEKARKLTALEFRFLQDVNKAENCCLCNRKKKVEKLREKRKAELQRILSRDEYIKYDAVENERIRSNIPLQVQ